MQNTSHPDKRACRHIAIEPGHVFSTSRTSVNSTSETQADSGVQKYRGGYFHGASDETDKLHSHLNVSGCKADIAAKVPERSMFWLGSPETLDAQFINSFQPEVTLSCLFHIVATPCCSETLVYESTMACREQLSMQ